MYHFSLFHASHHLEPIVATDDEVKHTLRLISFSTGVNFFTEIFMCFLEIEAEVEAVKGVSKTVCPLKIVLDRVVLTSTGVLLGLWQVRISRTPCCL
jgi:hypothetical protein